MRTLLLFIAVFVIGLGLAFYVVRAPQAAAGWVVTSPDTAEIVAAVAGTDSIIAVADECNWPPALQQKPHVGSFGQVNLEKLAELHPSLVLTAAPRKTPHQRLLPSAIAPRASRCVAPTTCWPPCAAWRISPADRPAPPSWQTALRRLCRRAGSRHTGRARLCGGVGGFWTVSGRSLLGEVVRLAVDATSTRTPTGNMP
jgi:hypothetical protein